MKLKERLAFMAVGGLLVLLGCAAPYPTFIIFRDVPESPSFVVIPANNYLHEVEFANEVESAILSAGAKVIQRPAIKEVTTEKQVGQKQADGNSIGTIAKSAEAKLIERYRAYDDLTADYIVYTYADAKQVRIIKKETKEVLAVVQYEPPFYKAYKLHKTLEGIGIPVRKVKIPKQRLGAN